MRLQFPVIRSPKQFSPVIDYGNDWCLSDKICLIEKSETTGPGMGTRTGMRGEEQDARQWELQTTSTQLTYGDRQEGKGIHRRTYLIPVLGLCLSQDITKYIQKCNPHAFIHPLE